MDIATAAMVFLFVFLSYFIGAYPTGHLVGKFFANVDIQEMGSKKGGATNVTRTTGDLALGVVVAVLDAGVKGAFWMFAIYFVFVVGLHLQWAALLCFAAILLGHIFPIFTKLKTGGAGIAVIVGGATILVPGLSYFLAIAAWLLTFHLSKGIRSLCNIVAVVVLLFSGALFEFSWQFTVFAVFATGLVIFAHRSNLKRIKQGTEDRSTWESMGQKISEIWSKRWSKRK